MIIRFQHYLHDDKESWYDSLREALEDAGVSADQEQFIMQNAGMPFYEVEFECELDTETGKVKVVGNDL
jgi:hypothetical protein